LLASQPVSIRSDSPAGVTKQSGLPAFDINRIDEQRLFGLADDAGEPATQNAAMKESARAK